MSQLADRALTSRERLLLIGNPERVHVGAHLHEAGQQLGLHVTFCDTRRAYDAPRPLQSLLWRLGRWPARLRPFSRAVLSACRQVRPTWLLTTGLAPLDREALEAIGALGVRRLNFLTDDPWNPAHRARWFLAALRHYDVVFSPRRSIRAELEAICRGGEVRYLPFGYNPEVHFPAPTGPEAGSGPIESDLLFAGGADPDRVPWLNAAIEAGLDVALYGGYWERYASTRPFARGLAEPATLRRAVRGAKVNLCLVRRANRDGHVMRTFEIPAMAGCMLTEDTEEHRALLGPEGECVLYFESSAQMVEKARWLLAHPAERQRLAAAAHRRITSEGQHSYRDRLATMTGLRPDAETEQG